MSGSRHLSIDVAGGGPTGLAFALALCAYRVPARIRIFDPRWRVEGGRVEWRDLAHGNRRRRQIVTIQSKVWSALPPAIQRTLFGRHDYSEVWPLGSDSPAHHGPPRNLPIRDIEDRLLDLARGAPGIELVPQRYDPTRTDLPELLAICEGAHSSTREYFIPQFGRPHADLYCVDGRPLEETILGMQVETAATAGEAVLLTAAQNRYLLNTHRGSGFLNMRLARDEAAELPGLGRTPDEGLPLDAVRASKLWPAIGEGLKLYGIDERSLATVRAFRCSLVHRPRFVAEVARGTWGCLLGDAANALHFWPGRGLNTGLKSALSLARCLARRRRGERLRAADLIEHEGVMQMLQAREVGNRSWQTMLMRDADGAPAPIDVRIRRGLQGPCDRAALTHELLARLQRMRMRLARRTGALPDDRLLAARLAALDERTLKVLVETGPWISAEVDVASLLPLPAERRAAETPLPHRWGRVGAGAVSRTPARAPLAQSNALGNRSIRSHASA
jgi:2-polyprenyl-6-methoxyphenol hydroxylase-like FAD-dependent oxidoreductase